MCADGRWSQPGRAEARSSAVTTRQRRHRDEFGPDNGHDYELGDSVPHLDGEGMFCIGVQHRDPDLAPVSGINRAWAIDDGEPVSGRKTGSGNHKSRIAIGQRNRNPGTHCGPSARSEHMVLCRMQIRSSITGVRIDGSLTARDEHFDAFSHESRVVQKTAQPMNADGV